MYDLTETSWDWVSDVKKATICSSEAKWIKIIKEYAKQYPDDVVIDCLPEDNYGMILAHCPKSWFKLKPPTKRNLSEEQRAAMSERMKKARESLK